MTISRSFSALNAAQHKHLAKCLGLTTSGTKVELQNLIKENLNSSKTSLTTPRIVSIDMGIRNLGVCVLESPGFTKASSDKPTRLKVIAWKKLDVLGQMSLTTELPTTPRNTARRSPRPAIDTSAFQPSLLSKTACSITQDLLTTYHPTHILIERQRFRSGGASAVQEWTLRVNMLESMIWASLETLRSARTALSGGKTGLMDTIPEAHAISPARVANFWCSDMSEGSTVVEESIFLEQPQSTKSFDKGRKKIEKKDKIALVRSWLAAEASTSMTADAVQLDLTPEARTTAEAFTTASAKGRKKNDEGSGGTAKLDDLADCLLQGAAWVRWQENKRRLKHLVFQDKLGQM